MIGKIYMGKILSVFLFGVFFTSLAFASAWQDKLYDEYDIEASGFLEMRQGWRIVDDPYEKGESISEARIQLELGRDFDWGIFQFKGDLVGDLVEENIRGELRELNLTFSPFDFMDIKIGRQTLTWGTGDLLFINDLFPKDWVSFFIGRDDEYLKAPSDAIKLSLFSDFFNLDFIYMPLFNSSDYIDGTRLSYWNPLLGRIAGRDFIFADDERNQVFRDSEFSMRLFKNMGSVEMALYGYYGFWKTPEGFSPQTMRLYAPRLGVYGASARSPLWGGIANLEMGYYDSIEDRDGDDPFVRNSEFRFLAGFEKELAKEFTGAFQYYVEIMEDYSEYEKSMGDGPKKDEFRHVLTLRLTKLLMNQNLTLSFFTYYSPSDNDAYMRLKAKYKITDAWAAEIGSNIFRREDDYTFFGQFNNNTNVYASVRMSF